MSFTPHPEQISVPCTLMRAGTSKGLYFHEADLPLPGPARDAFLKAAVGSQDLLQIDGLGGSRLVTAKIAIVRPSDREGVDVDYTYAIVPPGRDMVVYTSNCGNISAGVGPFAIDGGLVEAIEPVTAVRIFNTNTQKLLTAHVAVSQGYARVAGEFAIPGVPGTGAEIFLDYTRTVGAKTGRALPTGNALDSIELDDGRVIDASLGDVANPCVFVRATDVGATGSELPDEINQADAMLDTLRELRGKAAQMLGLCSTWMDAERDSPALPLMVLVAPPADYIDSNGTHLEASAMDLRARLVFYGKCHESMAGTGSMCTAAMSRVEGSIVNQVASNVHSDRLRIGHPLGVMSVSVDVDVAQARSGAEIGFTRLGFSRTARRLMDGRVYVARAVLPEPLIEGDSR
jgi:2-methylaconitate cis-trans-isomerase PrpF